MRLLHTRRKNLYLYFLPNVLWKYAGLCFAHLVRISLPHLMLNKLDIFEKTPGIGRWKPPYYSPPSVKIHSTANEVGKGGISGLHHQSHWEMHHLLTLLKTNHWEIDEIESLEDSKIPAKWKASFFMWSSCEVAELFSKHWLSCQVLIFVCIAYITTYYNILN